MRKVLFVCSENAGRSQMAAAFFNTLAAGIDIMAESAGTIPAPAINPIVVAAMQEKGIDISANTPKLFNSDIANQYERLISFGCLVKSTFTSGVQARIEDWDVADPKEKELAEVREIRDSIEAKIKELCLTLQP